MKRLTPVNIGRLTGSSGPASSADLEKIFLGGCPAAQNPQAVIKHTLVEEALCSVRVG